MAANHRAATSFSSIREKKMQQNLAVPGTLVLDAAAACGDVSRSPFGEECHLRVRGTDGAYSIVDYRAPAGFGPARHTHRRRRDHPASRRPDRGVDPAARLHHVTG